MSKNRDKVVQLLEERLYFERSGVKLYDAIIAKMEQVGGEPMARMLDQMREHRDQEREHELWLEQQLGGPGGPPRPDGERLRRVKTASEGIEKVVFNESAVEKLAFRDVLGENANMPTWP